MYFAPYARKTIPNNKKERVITTKRTTKNMSLHDLS